MKSPPIGEPCRCSRPDARRDPPDGERPTRAILPAHDQRRVVVAQVCPVSAVGRHRDGSAPQGAGRTDRAGGDPGGRRAPGRRGAPDVRRRRPGPEGGGRLGDRLAGRADRLGVDRRDRPPRRARGAEVRRAGEDHRGRAGRVAADQPDGSRPPARRDRRDRAVPGPTARDAPGGLLRHGVPPRDAAGRPDRADPPPVRGVRASGDTGSTGSPTPT